MGLLLAGSLTLGGAPTDSNLMSGLVWRNIGPFGGGRLAVTGAVGQPGVFYAGLPAWIMNLKIAGNQRDMA